MGRILEQNAVRFKDVSKRAERKITMLLQIQNLLSIIPDIQTSIQSSDAALLKTIYEFLGDETLYTINNLINETINEDVVINFKKTSMVAKNTKERI